MKLFGIGASAAAAVPAVLAKSVKAIEKPKDLPKIEKPRSRECGGWVEPPPYTPPPENPLEASKKAVATMRGGRHRGDLQGCTITFRNDKDETVTFRLGEGSLTWTQQREFEYELDRGKLDTVRVADEQPIDVELDMQYDWIQACSDVIDRPIDVIRSSGPEGLDMFVEMDDEWYEFRGFHWESMEWSLSEGLLSLTGRCMEV